MPELAEIHLMSVFINQKTRNKKLVSITKNPESKSKRKFDLPTRFQMYTGGTTVIRSESIGKELGINFYNRGGIHANDHCLVFKLGMTGAFEFSELGESLPKHAHILFEFSDGSVLSFVDSRRFGTWKWGGFNKKRSPDIYFQPIGWKGYIEMLLENNDERLEKPIGSVLLDQSVFNGIGNYLRAEILYRADIDPYMTAKEVLGNHNRL